ncbi:biogenesis of lysosome-related organelles complex 1 subunit 2 [Aplysia californica]|uniref:Biogenesis of lysosome-related organelles complex 1 subunit 2 n=1 Tax=Aplysia californica TaxID=6500 RepID=A0ABM0JNU9_APLCA|nr:biogenesis of lysosome-related organelles complex 1 subunit 2 [Aplysia californica]
MAESQKTLLEDTTTSAQRSEKSDSDASEPQVDLQDKTEDVRKNSGVSEKAHHGNLPSDVVELCRETFQKTAEYLQGELDGTIEDYKLLEKMNSVTMNKYSEMKHIALSISGALKDLNEKYQRLHPYLQQIDLVEESVTDLERAAYSLDQYSKRLEIKFKVLEKR